MKKPKKTKTIKYPTWKIRGDPTPNERLVICDSCGYAQWITHGSNPVLCHHTYHHSNGKYARMREATAEEYEEGKTHLKEIVG